LIEDIQPLQWAWANSFSPRMQSMDTDNASETVEASLMVSLWIGNAGVTTQAHYDMPANVFVQIRYVPPSDSA
jgi:hypothetical protein